MTIAFAANVGNRVGVRHAAAARSARAVPAATLLRRLGWHYRTVSCRDPEGRRTALHVRRRADEVVEVQLAEGHVARLSNVQAGRLRTALREVLIDHPPKHEDLSPDSTLAGIHAANRCRELT